MALCTFTALYSHHCYLLPELVHLSKQKLHPLQPALVPLVRLLSCAQACSGWALQTEPSPASPFVWCLWLSVVFHGFTPATALSALSSSSWLSTAPLCGDHSLSIHSAVKNSIFRAVTVLLAPTSVLTSLGFRSQPHRVYKGDQLSPDHPPSVPLSWDAWKGLARLALHPEPPSWPPSWCLGVLRAWRRLGQGGGVTAGPVSWRCTA